MRMHIKGRWLFSAFKLRGSGSYPLPLEGERPKGKGLARAKNDDFEALLIFMCCTNPLSPQNFFCTQLRDRTSYGSSLNPEPSIRSYYMTNEEI